MQALKRIIEKAISVLTTSERQKLFRLILLHSVISIADIVSLALLLALIHFYTHSSTGHSKFDQAAEILQRRSYGLPLIFLLLFFVAKNIASYLAVKAQFDYIYEVASRISKTNLLRYLNGSYLDYTQLNPSVHISRISYQPMEFSTFVLAGIQQLSTELILTGVAIIAIILFNAKLFLLLLLVLMPPVVLAAYFSRKRLNAARHQVKESAENATQYLHEGIASYIESNVFNSKQLFVGRYEAGHQRLSKTLADLQITQAIPQRFVEVFAIFGLLVLILLNRYNGNAALELVNIGAFVAAAYKIIPGVTRIANISAQMRMYQHSIDAVGSSNKEFAVVNDINDGLSVETLSMQNIVFGHHDKKVLHLFNLEMKRGDFIGISSDSGKGKTTMLNLLLGFLEPESGSICFNGEVTKATERRQYWTDIAYVKQQPFLIHDTIAKNITLDETYDAGKLEHAIKLAGLEGFISHFPAGVDKIITDGGKNISGGQRQRIALARAFYKDAQLLIMDEPFSELDAASEEAILEHLQTLARCGKMILLITHNNRSLQFCAKTVSIDG